MKKFAAIALSLAVLSSAAIAQTPPVVDPTTGAAVAPGQAPTVIITGGIAGGGIALALLPLLLLLAIGGGSGGSGSGSGSVSVSH